MKSAFNMVSNSKLSTFLHPSKPGKCILTIQHKWQWFHVTGTSINRDHVYSGLTHALSQKKHSSSWINVCNKHYKINFRLPVKERQFVCVTHCLVFYQPDIKCQQCMWTNLKYSVFIFTFSCKMSGQIINRSRKLKYLTLSPKPACEPECHSVRSCHTHFSEVHFNIIL
jgi:hypothetical protein